MEQMNCSYLIQMPRVFSERPGPLRSLAIAPMFKRDEAIGALIVGSIGNNSYDDTDVSFVQHLTDQLSISIQNARLYKQVSRAKDEWEATFMAVTDPILLIDTDYNVLLQAIKARQPACEVIIITGYSTVKTAVAAMQLGAYE